MSRTMHVIKRSTPITAPVMVYASVVMESFVVESVEDGVEINSVALGSSNLSEEGCPDVSISKHSGSKNESICVGQLWSTLSRMLPMTKDFSPSCIHCSRESTNIDGSGRSSVP